MIIDYKSFKIDVLNKYATKQILYRFKTERYESQELQLVTKHISGKNVVLELGGCLGVISLQINSVLEDDFKCKHIVVEANPELISCLNSTKQLNNSKFTVEHCLVSKKKRQFFIYNKVVAGSAHRKDDIEKGKKAVNVNSVSVNSLGKKYNLIFDTVVIDIEGGELQFFVEHQKYLKTHVKLIIVELHGHLMNSKIFNRKCIQLLNKLGFKQTDKLGTVYVFSRI